MKLLTLNTHSLMEKDYETKLKKLANVIIERDIDLIALQEIMQPINGKILNSSDSIPLKEGNYALSVLDELKQKGYEYDLFFHGFKKSYDKFDEGLAIISKNKIEEKAIINLPPFGDYNNWKTRKAIGAKINNKWYFCVHMGWWDDEKAPFKIQLEALLKSLPLDNEVYIMGDFNSLADEKGKGYECVIKSGLYDTYLLANKKDEGTTALSQIDGWERDKDPKKMRIDYIFTNRKIKVESSLVIFNGKNEDIISDHYGIIVTL